MVAILATQEFQARYAHILGSKFVIRALILGLQYPTLETEKDLFEDGRNLRIIRIPLLRREVDEARNEIISYREKERIDNYSTISYELPLVVYRNLLYPDISDCLSGLYSSEIPYQGMLPVSRYEGGSHVISKERVDIEAPTVGELWLAFDLPK